MMRYPKQKHPALISAPGAKTSKSERSKLLRCGFVALQDVVPVDQAVDEGFEVFRAGVAVVDVIGMFPHVDAEDRGGAVDQRIFAVRRLGDFELAVLDRNPGPAGAELGGAGGDEIGLELVVAAEIGGEGCFQLAGQLVAAAALLQLLPEMDMVVVLGRVVEQARIGAEGLLDDLLDRKVAQARFRSQLVAVVDIGLVVLVMVVFQGFLGHERGKRFVVIGKCRQFESHGLISFWQ